MEREWRGNVRPSADTSALVEVEWMSMAMR